MNVEDPHNPHLLLIVKHHDHTKMTTQNKLVLKREKATYNMNNTQKGSKQVGVGLSTQLAKDPLKKTTKNEEETKKQKKN